MAARSSKKSPVHAAAVSSVGVRTVHTTKIAIAAMFLGAAAFAAAAAGVRTSVCTSDDTVAVSSGVVAVCAGQTIVLNDALALDLPQVIVDSYSDALLTVHVTNSSEVFNTKVQLRKNETHIIPIGSGTAQLTAVYKGKNEEKQAVVMMALDSSTTASEAISNPLPPSLASANNTPQGLLTYGLDQSVFEFTITAPETNGVAVSQMLFEIVAGGDTASWLECETFIGFRLPLIQAHEEHPLFLTVGDEAEIPAQVIYLTKEGYLCEPGSEAQYAVFLFANDVVILPGQTTMLKLRLADTVEIAEASDVPGLLLFRIPDELSVPPKAFVYGKSFIWYVPGLPNMTYNGDVVGLPVTGKGLLVD